MIPSPTRECSSESALESVRSGRVSDPVRMDVVDSNKERRSELPLRG